MPATTAVGPDVAQPETANALSRKHSKWAVAFGREIAEAQPGWREKLDRHPLLADDVTDSVLAAMTHAVRYFDPADGPFRETATPLIRKIVLDTLAGQKPYVLTPEIIPETREERTTMQPTTVYSNGHVNRLGELSMPEPEPGPPLTSADLTPRDRDSLKRIAHAHKGALSAGELAAEWAKDSGRLFDSRIIRFLAKATRMPLAAVEPRERDLKRRKPKHVPQASGGTEAKRTHKRSNQGSNRNLIPADAPAPANLRDTNLCAAPTPAAPVDAVAAMRAMANVLKALRGLDPAIARAALELAAESFAA